MENIVEILEALKSGRAVINMKGMEKNDPLFNGDYENAAVVGVIFNETRFNISLRMVIHGEFIVPENHRGSLPERIATKTYRCISIVRDGEVVCKGLEVVNGTKKIGSYVSFEGLRIVPQASGDLKSYFRKYYSLQACKGKKKVLEHLLDKCTATAVDALEVQYGAENAAYLKSLGLTESGYSPVTEYHPDTEAHPEMITKIKGLSIPSMNAYMQKVASGKKLGIGEELLGTYYSQMSQWNQAELEETLASVKHTIDEDSRSLAILRDSLFDYSSCTINMEIDGRMFECSLIRK